MGKMNNHSSDSPSPRPKTTNRSVRPCTAPAESMHHQPLTTFSRVGSARQPIASSSNAVTCSSTTSVATSSCSSYDTTTQIDSTSNVPSFTCQSHFKNLGRKIQHFYGTCQLCDVTLVCDNRRIPCHRLLLAAASEYFSAMFTSGMNEAHQKEIEIHAIEPSALEALISYCYSGMIQLEEWNVESILSGACLLQLIDVIDACSDFLKTQLHPSNCLGIRSFADAQGCHRLHQSAHGFATEHFMDVMQQSEFLLLSIDDVFRLLNCDDLNVTSEICVYQALCLWIQYDLKSRQSLVGQLLSAVRLPFLTPEFIADNIETNVLFRDDRTCQNLIMEALKYHLLPERRNNMELGARARPRKSTSGTMYAVGGMDSNKGALTIERYNFLRDCWMTVGEMSGRRLQFGVTVIEGKLYMAGGRDGLKTLSSFECWDPITGQWQQMPPMMTPRHGLGVALLEGVLYVCGGHDGWAYLSSVERWDPETKTWSYVCEMNSARNTAGLAVLSGKLYSIGGRDSSQVLRTVECYNPHTNKWTVLAPMNKRRSSVGIGVLDGYIYAVGGMDAPASNPCSARFDCVERYDPRTDQWTMVANLNVGRDGVGVCALADRLFAIGGYNGQQYMSLVECYDPETNQWKRVASLMTGRAGSCVVVVPMKTNDITTSPKPNVRPTTQTPIRNVRRIDKLMAQSSPCSNSI